MAWNWDDFSGWMRQLGVDPQLINRGPYIPAMPSKMITFTFAGGAGLLAEGEIDDQTFQVRVRGDANDQSGPEQLANSVDYLLLRASLPVSIGSTRFLALDRAGSPPTPLGPPDDGDRFEYVSNYRLVVGA
jgi:minor capsid protein